MGAHKKNPQVNCDNYNQGLISWEIKIVQLDSIIAPFYAVYVNLQKIQSSLLLNIPLSIHSMLEYNRTIMYTNSLVLYNITEQHSYTHKTLKFCPTLTLKAAEGWGGGGGW